jgi:hypothetical protein
MRLLSLRPPALPPALRLPLPLVRRLLPLLALWAPLVLEAPFTRLVRLLALLVRLLVRLLALLALLALLVRLSPPLALTRLAWLLLLPGAFGGEFGVGRWLGEKMFPASPGGIRTGVSLTGALPS